MTPLPEAVRRACGRLRNGVPSCEYPTCGCSLSVAMSPVFVTALLATARAEGAAEEREEIAVMISRWAELIGLPHAAASAKDAVNFSFGWAAAAIRDRKGAAP